MNKKTLKALVLALAVLFPMQNVFADYCTSLGNSTHTARYLNAFTLTDGTNEAVVSDIQTSTKQAVYQDKTSVVLETEAGATISFSAITWNGEWMHGYAFADFNNDGTFDSSDLVSYNFYSTTDAASGQNSKGETVQNNCNVTAANMPEWTIPTDLAPGDYRFRFKVDWNSLDPCGASDIAGNGGAAVDMTIRIASQAASRTISVSVNPEEAGTVTINGEEITEVTAEGGITLIATPAEGYQFVNWTLDGEEVSTSEKLVDGTEGDKAYVANFVALEVYTVAVSVNDATMGTAESTAEGSVYEGTEITLVATAETGYVFENWTVDGTEVSTNATFVTTVDASAEYVANFRALEVYTVSVSVNDATMGTAVATAEGSVYEGTQITLMATAADGYVFDNWTVAGAVVSENATFTTTVNASTEYVANFNIVPTKLKLVDVFSSFQESSWYPLSNIIDGDYNTESYTQISSGESVTVVLEEESTIGDIVLVFYNYSSYQPSRAKIQVSSDNETYYDVDGCSFTRSEISGGQIILDADGASAKYVRLVFEETQWFDMFEFEVYESPVKVSSRTISVSVNDSTMGTAYVGEEGTTSLSEQTGAVKVVAVANEGYEFVNWTVNGEVVSTVATVIDKTDGDKEYVANFKGSAVYNVTVSANNEMMGTATATQTGEIFNNTEITLTATPNEGYEFINWTVGETVVSKDAIFTVKVVEDAAYVANFRMKLAKINLAGVEAEAFLSVYDIEDVIDGSYTSYSSGYQSEGASVIVELPEEMPIGEVKLYFYVPSYYPMGTAKILVSSDKTLWTDIEGSQFGNDDLVYNSESGLSVITIDAKDAVAKYVKMTIVEPEYYMYMYEFEVYEATVNVAPRTISVSVNDDTMGSAYVGIEGTTSLEEQTGAVKVSATVADNAYRFVNWTLDGEVVSTALTFVDRTEGDKAYVANFEAKPIYTVGVSSSSAKRGSASCDAAEVVYEGDVVTFTATPTDGYGFVNWTVNGEVVSEENPYALEITESVALVANFDVNPELDRSAWSIYTVSSQYAGIDGSDYVTGEKAIDGKFSTYWHTDWDNAANKKVPQWIVFDLGAVKSFDSFNYVSRAESQNQNGNIGGYQIYVSTEAPDVNDLTGTMEVINEGTFTYPAQEHKVELGKAYSGQYVMLYATSTYGDGGANMFANCAEFYLYLSSYSVTVSPSNPAHGTVYIETEGTTSYPCSVEGTDVVTITAIAADKYQFVNWTLEGEVVSTEAVYTTDEVKESRDYVANFEFAPIAPRTITAAVNNAAKGSVVFKAPVSTETSVVSDSIVIVEAIPATTDDFFVNWTINGTEVGTETTYEYLDEAEATIQANFISKYIVTVQPNDNGKITVKQGESTVASGDRVLEGENITITVKANVRHELKELYVNGENVFAQYKAAGSYTLAVTEATTISAVYGDPICYFTYTCTGNGWIEAWESDSYDETAYEEETLELPLSPVGYQYAYGEEVPFLSTLAIFPVAGEGDELVSISVNGEELEVSEESDIINFGDFFIDEVEGPVHVIAAFTGDYTGVEDAEVSETSIYSVAGGIVVEVAETATASIYSIAGVLVSEQTVSDKATIAMEKGVYIVKVADKVAKVIVK